MNKILIDHLTEKLKKINSFDDQDPLWKSGFLAVLVGLHNEIIENSIIFMPSSLKNEMIVAREDEYERWTINKTLNWEVCRLENNQKYIHISTNNQSIAQQQMKKIREEYCYIAMCNAFQNYFNEGQNQVTKKS